MTAEQDRLTIDVRGGTPTSDELAAIIAVVSEAYEREAAAATADDTAAPSAWNRTRLRAPLRRDVGWGRFSG